MCLRFVGLPVDAEHGFLVQPQLPLRCSQQRREEALKGQNSINTCRMKATLNMKGLTIMLFTLTLGEKM